MLDKYIQIPIAMGKEPYYFFQIKARIYFFATY